ncbi:MAG: hypothetical protein COB41_00340 [Proteobacteria bacterium]|nr:MAG: hypothetical protein COB41_00340 [Pseudomonadota bacterium]
MSEVSDAPVEVSVDDSIEISDNISTDGSGSSEVSEGLTVENAVLEALGGESEVVEELEEGSDVTEEVVDNFKKIFKLKVDGQEIEEELDFNDEERIIRALQKEKAFDKRSQEFSGLQKKVGSFVDNLKENTFDTLQNMGIDIEELVLQYAQNAVTESEKAPEVLAREKMEKELQDLKKERDNAKKEKEDGDIERMRNQQAQEIQTEIMSALDSVETVLPKKNSWVLRKVAETMMLAMNNGYPEVKAQDVIPLVEKQYKSDLKSMFDILPEEVLEQVVGKNNFDRVRKKRVRKRKGSTETANQAVRQTNSKGSDTTETAGKEKTYKDLFDYRF